jgi:hypothetical protein
VRKIGQRSAYASPMPPTSLLACRPAPGRAHGVRCVVIPAHTHPGAVGQQRLPEGAAEQQHGHGGSATVCEVRPPPTARYSLIYLTKNQNFSII